MGGPTAAAPIVSKKSSWRARLVTIFAILAIYVGSLAGHFWLNSSSRQLAGPNLETSTETVVLLDLTEINPLDNTAEASVVVIPEQSLVDPEFGVLNTELTVLLYPTTEFGELDFPAGHVPKRMTTTMEASGDADRWPFDSYATRTISADVFVGSGNSRRFVPARVAVSGSLYGWDIHSSREGPRTQSGGIDDNATITFTRSRGPLALILGICLVLVTLPALALYAAIEMVRGKKKFVPPFSTWFAAMLFSVVPIRNVLPGDPPPGSWIDEALVLWVLIALVVAMVIYVVAWARHSD